MTFSYFDIDPDEYLKWQSYAKAEWVTDYQYVTGARLVPSSRPKIRELPPYYLHLIEEKLRVLIDVASGYKLAVPWLFLLSVAAHLVAAGSSLRSRRVSFELMYGLVILGGIAALISILTYIKITLWTINRPLFSAYPLVLLYISLMTSYLFKTLFTRDHPTADHQYP